MQDKIINISGREVGGNAPCYIIAEVGINHMGNPELAWEMIDAAWSSGADAVKIQTFNTPEFLHPSHPCYKLDMDCQLSWEDELDLWNKARKKGIVLFSTPEDHGSLEFIKKQKPPLIKVAAMDFDCKEHVQAVSKLGLPTILSSGMSTLEETLRTVRWVEEAGNTDSIVLHCVSLYPAPAKAMNLRAIQTLAGILSCPVGFSDHSQGIHIPLSAVALGAKVIEKHFTLDKKLEGPDQACSMDPAELSELKHQIRELESALGHGRKEPAEEEIPPRLFKRRGVYAARNMKRGESITRKDVHFLAPSSVDSTMYLWTDIKSSQLKCDIAKGEIITLDKVG
ncbi:N-acetylneuraminate synthase family protein [Maridesulfovibrio sp.]|uniref:N-acetylneuraminate synthase family protein n=1 Tax=unclassified Maridesulfovibrio TaxID=2794999 RepID=UPI003B006455